MSISVSFYEPTVSPLGASVSVGIPILNEAMNLSWVFRRMPSHALRVDVIVVDEQRKRKGVPVRARFVAASGDTVVMPDADGSIGPQKISWFVSPLQHDCDYVEGSRELVPAMESHRLSDWPRLKLENQKGPTKIGTVMPTYNERGGC